MKADIIVDMSYFIIYFISICNITIIFNSDNICSQYFIVIMCSQ